MAAPLGPPAPRVILRIIAVNQSTHPLKGPPAADTPEVIERKRREAAEAKKWEEEAKRVAGPIPPVPQLIPGASEEQYKKYMIDKFEYEAWENKIILLGRKLRKEHEDASRSHHP